MEVFQTVTEAPDPPPMAPPLVPPPGEPPPDLIPMTFLMARTIQNSSRTWPLSVLLDSGSTSTWIHRRALPHGVTPKKTDALPGSTVAGNFVSNLVVTLQDVSLPELQRNATLPTIDARVIEADCRYDVILGRDACRFFRLNLDFDNNVIKHPLGERPMQAFPSINKESFAILGQQLMLDHCDAYLFDEKPSDRNDEDVFAPAPPSEDEDVFPFDDPEQDLSPNNDTKSDAFKATQRPDIASARYEHHDVHDVVRRCSHLSQEQQNQLYDVLSKYPELFDNKLGVYPHEKIHLEVHDDAVPKATRAYPVPRSQLDLFKGELDRLVEIGVLEPAGRSEWISGTFITPKKDGTVRWVSDFRALNKVLKRKVYPIPRVQDILSRRTGYKFLSKLDISMQYYTFELDESCRDLTTIATPFGLFRYQRLPMGISTSPDIAQEIMEKVLNGIDDVEAYIDDIAAFSDSYDDHMDLLDRVLSRLQDNGFTVNPLKCEWAVQETDFLGHWLTPNGIQPWKKKVNAILHMQPPSNPKQLRAFLGLVTYYRDMWPGRSHVLSPLTDLLKVCKPGRPWQWPANCQNAFEEMKRLVAADTLLAYPDHNKPFHIETDASDLQLGAVIKQSGRPVAYFTRKLNDAQRNYTTIEKELLSVVETLREFRPMLLGSEIHVYTDHRNLTHKLTQFSTQRVMRWRILIEEFSPKFHYLKGPHNVVADALSRLPNSLASYLVICPTSVPPRSNIVNHTDDFFSFLDTEMVDCFLLQWNTCEARQGEFPGSDAAAVTPQSRGLHSDIAFDTRPRSHSISTSSHLPTYMFHPRFDQQDRKPFHFSTIHHYQQKDQRILAFHQQDPQRFFFQSLNGFNILCEQLVPTKPDWVIVCPDDMLPKLVDYYHQLTVHTNGIDRLEALIKRHWSHDRIRDECTRVLNACSVCPQVRTGARQYGDLAPRDAPITPWHEVHLDCVGTWELELPSKVKIYFDALTMIDPVTNLIEIVRIPPKPDSTKYEPSRNGETMKRLFENHWLSRYPMPRRVLHDGGPEFNNADFHFRTMDIGSTRAMPSPHTPTANAVLEATHKAIGQVFRTLCLLYPPQNQDEAERLTDDAIATAMHASRCSPNSSLGNYSPGALVFQRDMLLDIPVLCDILTLTKHRQALIDKRLLKANAKRINHEFKVGEKVFIKNFSRTHKMQQVRLGPYPIIQVHTNNTVTIDRNPIHERTSIRHIIPFRGSTSVTPETSIPAPHPSTQGC